MGSRGTIIVGPRSTNSGASAARAVAPISCTAPSRVRAWKEKPDGVPKASNTTYERPRWSASITPARVSSPATSTSLEKKRKMRR